MRVPGSRAFAVPSQNGYVLIRMGKRSSQTHPKFSHDHSVRFCLVS